MINIERVFDNLFDDYRIIAPRLSNCAKNNVTNMQANNADNFYDTNITDTQTKITTLDTALTTKGDDSSTSIGGTTEKNEARIACQNFISQQEGLIKSKYGKKSGKYKEFYPSGINGFAHASDAEFETMMNVYVAKAVKYTADLGAPFVAAATAVSQAYTDEREDHNSDNTDVTTARSNENAAFIALQLQMTANVLEVAKHNIGNPAAAKLYFNTSLLFADYHQRVFNGTIEASGFVMLIEHKFKTDDMLKITLTGAPNVRLFLSDNPDGAAGTGQEANGNAVTEISVNGFNVNFETNRYLLVYNTSTTEAVTYKIEI